RHRFRALPDLRSFPTRRSSDLHRLSALYNPVAHKVFEDLGKTLARTYSEHAHLLLFRLELGLKLPVLLEHVLYLYPVELAQLERDRKSTRLNSSHVSISYAVFC